MNTDPATVPTTRLTLRPLKHAGQPMEPEAPAPSPRSFFEMPKITAAGEWATVGVTIPKVCASVQGRPVDIMKTIYGDGEEARANAKAASATGALLRLAVRVANLNKAAGEIGAGMLAQLVDEAAAALRKAGAPETIEGKAQA